MTDVSVHGAEGRMGRLVTALVEESLPCRLAALVTEPGRSLPVGSLHPELPLTAQDDMASVLPVGGVIVDFSLAPALPGLLEGGRATKSAIVTGTTGFTEDQLGQLRQYARSYPVVQAANFSLGIPALALVLELLGGKLPAGFKAEEVEIHHKRKIDRPSGTALWLAEKWNDVRGTTDVPVHSARLGGIVGEHKWIIADEEETLEITHRAHSRNAFLRGVLPAIKFAAAAEPGLYDLPDVLRGLAG